MATTESSALGAHPSTDLTERGRKLYREHAHDFVCRNGAWLVASDTVPG